MFWSGSPDCKLLLLFFVFFQVRDKGKKMPCLPPSSACFDELNERKLCGKFPTLKFIYSLKKSYFYFIIFLSTHGL